MKEKVDIGFKVVLLAILLTFLALYGQSYQNGRYQLVKDFVVLDTKSGAIYVPMKGSDEHSFLRVQDAGWYKLNVIESRK